MVCVVSSVDPIVLGVNVFPSETEVDSNVFVVKHDGVTTTSDVYTNVIIFTIKICVNVHRPGDEIMSVSIDVAVDVASEVEREEATSARINKASAS
jgi:hypothetical protein